MKYFILGLLKIFGVILAAIVIAPLLIFGCLQLIGGAKKSRAMDIVDSISKKYGL